MWLGLKIASRRLLKQWPPRRQKLTNIEQIVGSFVARLITFWKQGQPLAPVALTRQDLGTHSEIVMVPQPLGLSGPMAQGHRRTTGTQDVDLILSQALRMNVHEVPSYCGSFVNHTTLGLRIGSITFGKSPTYQPVTNLSEFIAKQVLVSQIRNRNKSQMLGLCSPIQG